MYSSSLKPPSLPPPTHPPTHPPISNRYDDPIIYITENGVSGPKEDAVKKDSEGLDDTFRQTFMQGYISEMYKAITFDKVGGWVGGLRSSFLCLSLLSLFYSIHPPTHPPTHLPSIGQGPGLFLLVPHGQF